MGLLTGIYRALGGKPNTPDVDDDGALLVRGTLTALLDLTELATETTLAAIRTALTAGAHGGLVVEGVSSGTPVPVSAASLPLPSLAATSTLQTSGAQIAQVSGGAKGATAAALITTTAAGNDHQAADVNETSASPAEDNLNAYAGPARILVNRKYTGTNITDAATHNAIVTGVGTLARIVINKATANAVIQIYDGLTSGGTLKATITMPAVLLENQIVIDYDMALTVGLTIVTSVAAQDITVMTNP